ncbi:cobalamin-5'-phosphate synthase [Natranaerovirga pectinivora]|uniref:Adenosylcobinamide-GDP ribazoletransferase n=1 Tax=Natranaerovirga pectinivora TaxID=682400 RepID=A0A4R3MPI2_9FIRM|nr:adenosylcobinamide-GDP ribazoletransferase [Natranaerovirga pectinivora]TCT15519.1 cobalamin-5'-phosphate synthase [Natranaerovirga pectinivora]
MKSFLLMITFLTRIPFPIKFEFNGETFVKGILFFPIIGVIIGALLSPIALLSNVLPNTYVNVFIIIGYLIIVGGLHLDGLADVCDGIFSCRKRERVFEIMSDSLIGAFGVISLVLYFLTFFVFLNPQWQVVLAFPIVGRCVGLITCGLFNYAKNEGMGKAMVDKATLKYALYAFVFGLVSTYLLGWVTLFAYGITVIISLLMVLRINKILGGITGDVIGLILETSQILFLISTGVGGILWTFIL